MMMMKNRHCHITNEITSMLFLCVLLSFLPANTRAQIGEHRDKLSVGVNGGMVMSRVGFTPDVSQDMHNGAIGGVMFRYTSEKYFSTICSMQAEINYSCIGWKENIVNTNDEPIYNENGTAEKYSRNLAYIQIPLLAHLAWGREEKGFNFFLNAGPQVGFLISDKKDANFAFTSEPDENTSGSTQQRAMDVQNKVDYGIAAGVGVEYSLRHAGSIGLEARYYYGLGNIYDNSKRDYFGKSNFSNIIIKCSYIFNIGH